MSERYAHPLITPARLLKEAVIYIRQSSPPQVRNNTGSTDVQKEQAGLARRYGWSDRLIRTIDEDLGRSGTGTEERTGWHEMLHLITKDIVGAVFVWNVSRLSRQLGDFEALRVLAKLYRVVLVIDGRPADPGDPQDTVMLQVQALLAQHENSQRAAIMKQGRVAKARRGTVVSRIPIGWIKRPDGSYDFDPEVQPAFNETIQIFREKQTVLGTVRTLRARGRELPSRPRPKGPIEWKTPSALAVRQLLTHPWYTGTFVYGRTEGIPALRKDKARRVRLPQDRWITKLDHHPAYYTVAEQEEFKRIMKAHRYEARRHPRNGAALCQGLLKCAQCGVSLSVNYPRKATFRYQCQRNQTTFGQPRCVNFPGKAVDDAVERLFLAVLNAPPVELLQQALAEARAAEQTYAARIEADRKRLKYAEQLARDRYRECDPRNRLVAADLENEFETAKQAAIDFEHRQASEPPRPPVEGTEEEIRELCELVSEIPKLFRDDAVTHRERKELLQCLIEKIVIQLDAEGIDGTIHWRSGETATFRVWRAPGVHRLIRERHDEGLTVPEIVKWLAEGDPQTGQSWPLTKAYIYELFKKWGLKPNVRPRIGRRRRSTPQRTAA